VLERIRAIASARLRAHLGGELIPAAALLAQGSLVGTLALMVRSELASWGFALFTLSFGAGLVSMTLLGEFGSLLRRDPAAAWSEALPATPFERRAAHALAVLVLLIALSVGALLPAVLLAPAEATLLQRALLLGASAAQALALGSLLLAVQALFGERVEGLLVLLQTLLVVAAVTGLLYAPALVPTVAALESGELSAAGGLALFPPTWYASLVADAPSSVDGVGAAWLLAATAVALVVLLVLPPAREGRGRRTRTLLARALAPLRALASRFWVRKEERAAFDLVYDALPLERDFVLRTYPMIGIPLAFLVVGAQGERGQGLEDLLALLLFTPAVYLPVLLAHVPVTASPEARWLLDGSPLARGAIEAGAIKALAVRFLAPLYLALVLLALVFAGPLFTLRLALPGALVSLISLRLLYPRCTLDLPLSTAADEIEVHHDWTGFLLTLAVVLTLLAIAAQRLVTGLGGSAALVAGLFLVELVLERVGLRRPAAGAAPGAGAGPREAD